jgi:hypothetical protein
MLDGVVSDFAIPVRLTNYSIPVLPPAKKIEKVAIKQKNWFFGAFGAPYRPSMAHAVQRQAGEGING